MKRIFVCTGMALLLAACAKPLPEDRLEYAGIWNGPEMSLQISREGSVRYRRWGGGSRVAVNAPLQAFAGNDFVVGIGPATTTFKVTAPPHLDRGMWKMTVDGVELSRIR